MKPTFNDINFNVPDVANVALKNLYTFFVFGLVLQIRPKNVLEVGVGNSPNSAHMILQALNYNERFGVQGKYHGIDTYVPDYFNKIFAPFLTETNHQYIQGNSADPKFFQGLPVMDLVLIDGNHSFANVLADTKNVMEANIFAHDGYFVYHDIQFSQTKIAISYAIERFKMNAFFMPKENICIARLKYDE